MCFYLRKELNFKLIYCNIIYIYILTNKATGLQELNYHYSIINHYLTEFKMNFKNFFTNLYPLGFLISVHGNWQPFIR